MKIGRLKVGPAGRKFQRGLKLHKTATCHTYRYSPKKDAHPRHFTLGPFPRKHVVTSQDRPRLKIEPRSQQMVCPYSGIVAERSEFTHPADWAATKKLAVHAALLDMPTHLERAMNAANPDLAKQIDIRALFPTPPPTSPRIIRCDTLRLIRCGVCRREYGLHAIGLFCPDCGAASILNHFDGEISLLEEQIAIAQRGEASPELTFRLLGNAHEDVLTAFEAIQKTVFRFGLSGLPATAAKKGRIGSDFQNLDKARKLFAKLGIDPFRSLDGKFAAMLARSIQKRHIIGHNLGIVDSRFRESHPASRLGDPTSISVREIRSFYRVGRIVVEELDKWVAVQDLVPFSSRNGRRMGKLMSSVREVS